MFWIRKVVSRLLFPLPLSVELILLGMVLLRFTRRRRLGRNLMIAGVLVLLVCSSTLTSRLLLRPLEKRYAPCLDPVVALESRSRNGSPEGQTDPPAAWIVVLGAGYYNAPRLPVPSRTSSKFLARFLEGVRLHRALPNASLFVSIAGTDATYRQKRAYLDALSALVGLSPASLELVTEARDTREEAACAVPVVGSSPFFLVTDPVHMPRAMQIFETLGLAPIASPVGYTSGEHPFTDLGITSLFPSAGGLGGTQRAVYEYLGLLRESLRRKP